VAKLRTVAVIVLITMTTAPHLSSVAFAQRPRRSKLARILVGRSEVSRQQQLAALSDSVRRRLEALDDLIYALQFHTEAIENGQEIPDCFAGLVDVIAKINRDTARDAVIQLLACERVDVAIIAADVLGERQIHEAIRPLIKQVDRPEFESLYGFRFNLVRALLRMEHPDAIEFLGKLASRLDGQLRHELDEQLQNIDVDDFQGDEQRFTAWNDSLTPVLVKSASFTESYDRIKLQRNQYYGIDIHAKRLLFILDHSGSMSERVYGGTRLTSAKYELIKAIDGLPEDAEFGILFFNDVVRAWREELLPATEDNKQEAFQFVRRIDAAKKTNTYGALRRGLEFDDQLETMFLLTDGKPTTGLIVAPGAIINDILRRNRTRHLTINTIGIAVEGQTESFLRNLSEHSNGEFRLPR
jgi:hypothetical protein